MKTIERISGEALWKRVDDGVRNDLIDALARYPDASGVVVFESEALDDKGMGTIFVIAGPSNTIKKLEEADNHRPTWKHYAHGWCPIAKARAEMPHPFLKKRPPAPLPSSPMPEPTPAGIETARNFARSYGDPINCPTVVKAVPVMVCYGKHIAYGAFVTRQFVYGAGSRYAEQGVVQPGDSYFSYEFHVAGQRPANRKAVLQWDTNLDVGPGHNMGLAEWYQGEEWTPPFHNPMAPLGLQYQIGHWVPMNFGPYKDELIDDTDLKRRKRLAMRVNFLD